MEIKRCVLSKKMLAGMGLCFLALLYGGCDILPERFYNFVEVLIFAQTDNTIAVLGVLFPLLAVIPAGTGYRSDRQEGYYGLVCRKMPTWRYCRIKMINGILGGALVLGIPNLLYYIVCIAVHPGFSALNSHVPINFMPGLYESAPLLYGGILVLNSAVCGSVFSLLGLGISAWVPNKYVAAFIPFAYCIFSGIVLDQFSRRLNAVMLFDLNTHSWSDNIWAVVVYDIVLLAAGAVLFLTGVYRDDF